jgi:hypothetical protein
LLKDNKELTQTLHVILMNCGLVYGV